MMNVDESLANVAVKINESESTDLTRCTVMINAFVACFIVSFVRIDKYLRNRTLEELIRVPPLLRQCRMVGDQIANPV